MANYIMKVLNAFTLLSFMFFGLTASALNAEPTLVALPDECYCWYEVGAITVLDKLEKNAHF